MDDRLKEIKLEIAYNKENINLLKDQLQELDRQLGVETESTSEYVATEADIQDIRARRDVKREELIQYHNILLDLMREEVDIALPNIDLFEAKSSADTKSISN
jgi:hypothetical protein